MMAKTAKPAKQKTPKKASKGAAAGKKPKKERSARASSHEGSGTKANGAADAIVGLLESPLVADMLAAGAAAALAAITQHRLTSRSEGSKQALKKTIKAAASAMGQRLSDEFEEILDSAKKAKSGPK